MSVRNVIDGPVIDANIVRQGQEDVLLRILNLLDHMEVRVIIVYININIVLICF